MSRRIFYLPVVFCILLFAWAGNSGCANIIPPDGGPRDTIPPRLVRVSPADSSVNFNSKRITFEFDEFIDLDRDYGTQLFFTPLFKTRPLVTARLRTLTVEFKDSLRANTTYTLKFGNAIRDVNENNPLTDFSYTFSTGRYLDSLEISGQARLAETGEADSTLTVVLYKNTLDSALIRELPDYATKVQRDGSFRFTNLPPGQWAIYAIGNAQTTKRYLSGEELGFTDSLVSSGDDSVSLVVSRPLRANGTAATALGQSQLPDVPGNNEKRLRFVPWNAGSLGLSDSFRMVFGYPLKSFDSSQVRLSRDSSYTTVPYKVRLDRGNRVMVINANWQENTSYNLELGKTFATDSLGRQLFKTDTLFFSTKKLSEYGNLVIRFSNVDSTRHPILQVIQNNNVIDSASISNGLFQRNLYQPGEYELRVILDLNNNGRWDPVEFFRARRQAEPIIRIDRKITVKPAWDNSYDIPL